MDVNVFRLASPAGFVSKFGSGGLRADGRTSLNSCRELTLRTSIVPEISGSASVRLGNTSVVAGVVLNTTQPRPESKSNGFFQVTLQSRSLNRREASAVSQKVEDILRPSIDTEALCIQAGKTVWHLHVSLVSLEEDGSLLDACVCAAVAALKSVQLPSLDAELRAGGDFYPGKPLQLRLDPVALTFCKLASGEWLPDCTAEEESVACARVTLVGGVTVSVGFSEGGCSSLEVADFLLPEAQRLISERRQLLV